MQTQSVDQLVGQTLGNYRVERLLGKGRLNAVYLAQHTMNRRVDALTLYLFPQRLSEEAHTRFLTRFRKEAAAVTSLRHEHILPVYEYGEHDGNPYLVTPYMMHGSLADILKQDGRYEHGEALPLLEQLVAGLSHAHSKGFIHGMLRPSNAVLNEDGSLRVAGFGLMHMLQLSGIEAERAGTPYAHLLSVASTFLAVPGYIAPEVVEGQAIDIRSDIYALGCILFELLSGRPPFEGQDPLEVARMHVKQNIPSLRSLCPDVPAALVAVVNLALGRDPERRFQSVQELGEAYAQASRGARGGGGTTAKRAATGGRSGALPGRQERSQETPRDGLNKWQLLPPIVTGTVPVVSSNILRPDTRRPDTGKSAPPTLTGFPDDIDSGAALTLPPPVPDICLHSKEREALAPRGAFLNAYGYEMPVEEEPSRRTRREPARPVEEEIVRPRSARREEVQPASPTVEAEPMAPPVRGEPPEGMGKSMVGEDPGKLIKQYAWWSQVGQLSSPALPFAQKLATEPREQQAPARDISLHPKEREALSPRGAFLNAYEYEPLRLPDPDAGRGRRSSGSAGGRGDRDMDMMGLGKSDANDLDWTMEPMLPAVVGSHARMARGDSGGGSQQMSRRRVAALLGGGVAAVAVAVVGLNLGKGTAQPNTTANVQTGTTTGTGTETQAQANGVIGNTTQAKGTAVMFTNPADGKQSLLIHLPDNTFVAYERACTHVGVYVNYDAALNKLVCPAHNAMFDPANGGAVTQGPATIALPQVKVQVNADGKITEV